MAPDHQAPVLVVELHEHAHERAERAGIDRDVLTRSDLQGDRPLATFQIFEGELAVRLFFEERHERGQ